MRLVVEQPLLNGGSPFNDETQLCFSTHPLGRDQQLTQVAGGVLGGVYQQAHHGRRHLSPAHAAQLGEDGEIGAAQLGKSMVDLLSKALLKP